VVQNSLITRKSHDIARKKNFTAKSEGEEGKLQCFNPPWMAD
jgi:hypothetical protein